jgi:exopolyphosphatase/guanosine-5'-triphosphate,3'-diphosphate pyrophosphatase
MEIKRLSIDIGAVRLTERYFLHNPPLPDERQQAATAIHDSFASVIGAALPREHVIGVAGTVTTLACLDQSLSDFDLRKVSGYTLTFGTVDRWCSRLAEMTGAEVLQLSHAAFGREDILYAGTLILRELMKEYALSSLRVSERGLRYGLVLREWERRSHATLG